MAYIDHVLAYTSMILVQFFLEQIPHSSLLNVNLCKYQSVTFNLGIFLGGGKHSGKCAYQHSSHKGLPAVPSNNTKLFKKILAWEWCTPVSVSSWLISLLPRITEAGCQEVETIYIH